jgi:hypothetical protein
MPQCTPTQHKNKIKWFTKIQSNAVRRVYLLSLNPNSQIVPTFPLASLSLLTEAEACQPTPGELRI